LTERGLIDLDHPQESQLRTKPLVLVEHGGGPKFVPGSETDARWQAFLKDYALTVRKDGYRADDPLPHLPDHRSWLSELQIRITDLPEQWNDRLLTVMLHAVNADGSVAEQPHARGDSRVNPKQHVWQNALTIYAPLEPGDTNIQWDKPVAVADAIAKGRYLLRVALGPMQPLQSVQSSGPDANRATEVVGTFSLDAPWPPGYQPPKILSWNDHRDAK
jgi:hypothetical protein